MNFPLVTWQVTAPQFTANNGSGPSTHGGVALWGFGLNAVPAMWPAPDTLAGEIETALTAVGCTVNAASYDFLDNTAPDLAPLTMTFDVDTAGNVITLDFGSTANAAVWGFDTNPVVIGPGSSVVFSTTYNPAGMWAPAGVSGDVTRTLRQRAAASSSDMSGLTTDVVNWGQVADIEVKSSLIPAANVFVWYATQSIYATKAGRLVADPNNILERMLEAAATGVTFRIYEGATTTSGFTNEDYLVAKMPGVVSKSAAGDVVQADDEPRLWSTTGLFFRGET